MKNLLSLKFWFSIKPGDLSDQGQIGLSVFVIALGLLGFYAWWWRKQNAKSLYRKVYGRTEAFGFTNAGIALFLLFFEYEAVPILSMRFWPLVWLASMIAWGWLIGKDAQRIPQIRNQIAEEKKLKKYIP